MATNQTDAIPQTSCGSSQKTPKPRSICEKVVGLCTIFQKLTYAGSLADLLFMEPDKLEDKVVSQAGAAPKRSTDLEDLKRRILKHAEEVFGSSEIAQRWLQEPNLATDGRAPIALVESESGYARVKMLLDRIDYGVLA